MRGWRTFRPACACESACACMCAHVSCYVRVRARMFACCSGPLLSSGHRLRPRGTVPRRPRRTILRIARGRSAFSASIDSARRGRCACSCVCRPAPCPLSPPWVSAACSRRRSGRSGVHVRARVRVCSEHAGVGPHHGMTRRRWPSAQAGWDGRTRVENDYMALHGALLTQLWAVASARLRGCRLRREVAPQSERRQTDGENSGRRATL